MDDFFASLTKSTTISTLNILGTIEDILVTWEIAGVKTAPGFVLSKRFSESVTALFEDCDPAAPWEHRQQISETRGAEILRTLGRECPHDSHYPSIKHALALAIADRILHDRQISAEIARGLYAQRRVHNLEKPQYINRVRWPAFVKPLILARDRGKCAICRVDIAGELLAAAHIDHIFPLAGGGCNDVVNLQLCCHKCNLSKAMKLRTPDSSVPHYHSRALKR